VFDPTRPFVAGQPGSPPPSDNVFFNGTNVNPYSGSAAGGNYAKVIFVPGKRHRIRLINTSVDNTYTISIVGHSMTVIATDFVPVYPYQTDSVYLSVGQRLDIVVDANQSVGTYWLNATFSSTGVCGSSMNPNPAAIVQYDGAPWWAPSELGLAPRDSLCMDDLAAVPIVKKPLPNPSFNGSTGSGELDVTLAVNSSISRVYWQVNGSAIDLQWERPTLQYVLDGDYNTLPNNLNVINLPNNNQVCLNLVSNVKSRKSYAKDITQFRGLVRASTNSGYVLTVFIPSGVSG